MAAPVVIDYYSDILCVWAWIAQRRIDELNNKLSGKIELRYHYLDVFGDACNKIPNQWAERGGYAGFAKHVIDSAAPYPDASINPDIWYKVRPNTSANAHLVLKAVELSYGKDKSIEIALLIRQAFYIDGQDIAQLSLLFSLLEAAGIDGERINKAMFDGSAMASLMADYQQAKALSLKGSPSYIIDNGRQVLYGNVGYRVLLANIEEHIRQPTEEASWC
ncbi:disulfide bond formation protein DsbA [Colwellia sp. 75C3]|uniref:DsbA family oxidoreductase n=1 Tax=Colwellia sp. 75C3 TaxID=888425 RepID=UPI000C321F26|nr:DsbA family protein [Colwellia sp. 75C3]PKG86457.1 disulfide bond formation protein DsbA [Colwellia sp. 75C3]